MINCKTIQNNEYFCYSWFTRSNKFCQRHLWCYRAAKNTLLEHPLGYSCINKNFTRPYNVCYLTDIAKNQFYKLKNIVPYNIQNTINKKHIRNIKCQSYSKLSEVKILSIGIASPLRILQWAEKTLPNGRIYGEILNANTLHHKTFKPHKGGLFCERIFGPLKDYECACGKSDKSLKQEHSRNPKQNILSSKNIILNDTKKMLQHLSIPRGQRKFCPECDVEYTWSIIRRYQLGYIKLNSPIVHIWFLKNSPSYLSLLLDLKKRYLQQITYCSEIITLENSKYQNNPKQFLLTPSKIFASWQKSIKNAKENKNVVTNNQERYYINDTLGQNKKYLSFPVGFTSAKAPLAAQAVYTKAQALVRHTCASARVVKKILYLRFLKRQQTVLNNLHDYNLKYPLIYNSNESDIYNSQTSTKGLLTDLSVIKTYKIESFKGLKSGYGEDTNIFTNFSKLYNKKYIYIKNRNLKAMQICKSVPYNFKENKDILNIKNKFWIWPYKKINNKILFVYSFSNQGDEKHIQNSSFKEDFLMIEQPGGCKYNINKKNCIIIKNFQSPESIKKNNSLAIIGNNKKNNLAIIRKKTILFDNKIFIYNIVHILDFIKLKFLCYKNFNRKLFKSTFGIKSQNILNKFLVTHAVLTGGSTFEKFAVNKKQKYMNNAYGLDKLSIYLYIKYKTDIKCFKKLIRLTFIKTWIKLYKQAYINALFKVIKKSKNLGFINYANIEVLQINLCHNYKNVSLFLQYIIEKYIANIHILLSTIYTKNVFGINDNILDNKSNIEFNRKACALQDEDLFIEAQKGVQNNNTEIKIFKNLKNYIKTIMFALKSILIQTQVTKITNVNYTLTDILSIMIKNIKPLKINKKFLPNVLNHDLTKSLRPDMSGRQLKEPLIKKIINTYTFLLLKPIIYYIYMFALANTKKSIRNISSQNPKNSFGTIDEKFISTQSFLRVNNRHNSVKKNIKMTTVIDDFMPKTQYNFSTYTDETIQLYKNLKTMKNSILKKNIPHVIQLSNNDMTTFHLRLRPDRSGRQLEDLLVKNLIFLKEKKIYKKTVYRKIPLGITQTGLGEEHDVKKFNITGIGLRNNIYTLSHRERWKINTNLWQYFIFYIQSWQQNRTDVQKKYIYEATSMHAYKYWHELNISKVSLPAAQTLIRYTCASARMVKNKYIYKNESFYNNNIKNTPYKYMESNAFFSGPGVVQQLLNELTFSEIKKLDKQNRFQLYQLNKTIYKTKKQVEIFLYDKNAQKQLKELCKKRDLLIRRTKLVRKLYHNNSEPSTMILTVLPVLPPDLRPIVKIGNQIAASDLNRLYQRVIYRNERFKKFLGLNSLNTHSEEMKYAQRLLQEAVDNLIQNGKSGKNSEKDSRGRLLKSLTDLLKGKQGRFRQFLLGKRVDYSGRSVIVVGPTLKLHECGIPIEMAKELYLPLILKILLNKKYAQTVIGAKKLMKNNTALTKELLREIMQISPILLNRAPTLHRLGFQAFIPKLIEGRAILLHPLVCSAFNADFDGDQMAVHIPITVEARIEAWKLMLARNNILSPATGEPLALPSQDMVLGCYYLTTIPHSNMNGYSPNALTGPFGLWAQHTKDLKGLSNHGLTQDKTKNNSIISLMKTIKKTNYAASETFENSIKSDKILSFNTHTMQHPLLARSAESKKFKIHTPLDPVNKNKYLQISYNTFTYFKNLQDVLNAYYRSNLLIHSLIWVQWTGFIENGNDQEEPIEIRITPIGKWIEITSNYHRFYSPEPGHLQDSSVGSNILLINQYILTTPGRILFNLMLHTLMSM